MFGTSLGIQWLRLYLPMLGVMGLIPGQGAKIPYTSGRKEKKKQKQYCGEFNKDFKNGPHPKKKNGGLHKVPISALLTRLSFFPTCPTEVAQRLIFVHPISSF